MKYMSMSRLLAQCLLVFALFGFGAAMAEPEPTLDQIYATAKSGQLDKAQTMVQQVLVAHPKSGKAYYVRAELYARQGDAEHAREALATAEKLNPGLPFAKPEAVQALRSELAPRAAPRVNSGLVTERERAPSYGGARANSSSSSWGLPLLLAGVVIVGAYFLFRRRDPAPVYVPQGGTGTYGGPQNFGSGGGGYPQYPQPGGYPQAGGTGLGGRIMGGVATGLAVGAGVMAAEAIGDRLMGHHNANAATVDNFDNGNDYQPINSNVNSDMGGADFGVNDGGSWDSGGSSSDVGGGDWDN